MNIRVLLFTAGIAAVQVLSAIELTADSNRLEAGEAFVKMLVEYQEPGRAGTKCRWDFRGMQILSEELPVEYFIPDSSHMDILCGREGRNRYYYRQGSDSLWCVGHENATFYIDYARPELLLRYPFAYGDSLTSRFEGAGRYGQRIPLFVGGTTTVTADAEGELRLPGETFGNALRVHRPPICEDMQRQLVGECGYVCLVCAAESLSGVRERDFHAAWYTGRYDTLGCIVLLSTRLSEWGE